jgi:NADH-quinone oxidoreductase subunit C
MLSFTDEMVASLIKDKFGDRILDISHTEDILTITMDEKSNVEIIRWLMSHTELQFLFLTDLCGLHYPEKTGAELGVVYHLHSFVNNIRIRLKIFTSAQHPVVKSLTPLFQSANWMERETYDFFGIQFEGHPNLKRILNMDDMNYFPLQKQYPLEDQTREDKNDKYFGR